MLWFPDPLIPLKIESQDYWLGGSLKTKMRDPGIQSSIFNVENDGSIEFSINQKTSVQESAKVSLFSRQEKWSFLTGNRTRVYRFEVCRANH